MSVHVCADVDKESERDTCDCVYKCVCRCVLVHMYNFVDRLT